MKQKGEHVTQASLSERSGVDRSAISRAIANERIPTLESLQALAPALEIDLRDLVADTTAEFRLNEATDTVKRSEHTAVVQTNFELQSRIVDLEAQLEVRTKHLAEEQLARRTADARKADLEASCDRLKSKLNDSQTSVEHLEKKIAEYEAALGRAVERFSTLNVRIAELQKELGDAKQSGKAGAILSGVAAAAGVATLGYLLTGKSSKEQAQDHAKSKSTKKE